MADGGELAAAFRALAEDAAQAGEDIGSSIARWTEETADIEDENVSRILAADAENARALRAIRADPGDIPVSDNSAADSGANEVARLLSGDEAPGNSDIAAEIPGSNYVPVSAENGSPRLFKRMFPELTEVNAPRFGRGPEWQQNCQSCVNAVDHTLAGNPASAVPRPDQGFPWPDSVTKTIGGGNPFVKVGGYDEITDQMTSAGAGARGVVWGRRFMQIGSRSIEVEGHVFNVVNRGGRVFYVDGQTGTFARLENFGILNLLRTN